MLNAVHETPTGFSWMPSEAIGHEVGVIQAFNQNMPFDEFTRLQFAGDLMPGATPETILATCFHRNHMTNGEGARSGRIAGRLRH